MHTDPLARRTRLQVAGVLLVVLLVAAACGGSKSGDNASSDQTLPKTDVTKAPSGPPKMGGKVTYGLEAETSGFNGASDRWAISGLMVAGAIYDPVAAYDANGVAQPYLAESWEHNDDYTQWKIKFRSGISFSNGQPLTAAAAVAFSDAFRASTLTGPAAANIKSAKVDPTDPMVEIIDMKSPWASFPSGLTSQAGYVPAPEQTEAIVAAANGDQSAKTKASAEPIGTGPFILQSWTPDSKLIATRNPNYWRKDADGQQLPYLNEVEFRPIPDVQNRANALAAGDVNEIQTSDPETIRHLQDDSNAGKIQTVVDQGSKETGFVMFNTEKPPFDNVNARLAVAYATDVDTYLSTQQFDPADIADSPFAPNTPWHIDTGFPRLDLEKSKEYLAKYKADTGLDLSFSIGTTPSPDNTRAVQLLSQQWAAVGINAAPKSIDQGTFIVDAATGNYEANLWRQFGAPDPDVDYVWWIGANARGTLTLNFARFANADADKALNAARASGDESVRKQSYADLQKVWTEQVPYIWLDHPTWLVAASNDVRNIPNQTLPDGQPASPFVLGAHRLTQTWIDT